MVFVFALIVAVTVSVVVVVVVIALVDAVAVVVAVVIIGVVVFVVLVVAVVLLLVLLLFMLMSFLLMFWFSLSSLQNPDQWARLFSTAFGRGAQALTRGVGRVPVLRCKTSARDGMDLAYLRGIVTNSGKYPTAYVLAFRASCCATCRSWLSKPGPRFLTHAKMQCNVYELLA